MNRAVRRLWVWGALVLCPVLIPAQGQLVLRPATADAGFPAEALKDSAVWETPAFLSGWRAAGANAGEAFRTFRGKCQVFGRVAHGAHGRFENGRLESVTIVVLDSGAWFGFVPNAEAKTVAATKGPQFVALYKQTVADVERGLAGLAGGPGRKVPFVDKGVLKHDAQIFHCGNLWARLVTRENQLVKITVTRSEAEAVNHLSAMRRTAKKDEQARLFAARVKTAESGDRLLGEVPVFVQGDRAYCGVATLAMAMQFLGLRLDTEDYAAGAGIRFGSTYHSNIREVIDASAVLANVKLPRTTQFEFARAKACIDAGLPVLVFRWWSQERDFIHSAFAKRFAGEPAATLPKPDPNDRKSWPARDDFAHSSLITGYNAARREVIFTESWGEFSRNRRMRIEEMEGTAYIAYYPRL